MENNYIIVEYNGTAHMRILKKTKEFLEAFKPKGCPFYDYSMFDLLQDWIKAYSWQIERNKKMSLADFVRKIRTDGKYVYKGAMIRILENDEKNGNGITQIERNKNGRERYLNLSSM